MGTSRSAAQFATKMSRAADSMGSNRSALMAGSLAAKAAVEQQFARDGLPVGAMIAGARWRGVGFNIDQSKGESFVFAKRPAHLFNNPTQPHVIGARKLATRGGFRSRSRQLDATRAFGGGVNTGLFGAGRDVKRGAKALTIGGVGFRAYALHPGTSGTGSMGKSMKQVQQRAPQAMSLDRVTSLRKVFQ